jgi:hypothetical protein
MCRRRRHFKILPRIQRPLRATLQSTLDFSFPSTTFIRASDCSFMHAFFVACYNFARKHEALKGQMPEMASGLMDHVWTIKDLVEKASEA